MENYNLTECVEESVIKAWNECLKDTDDDIYISDILDKYMNQDDGFFMNTSGTLLYRFLMRNLAETLNLNVDDFKDSVEKLSVELATNKNMDFYMVSDKKEQEERKEQWYKWLTEGFSLKQRLFVYKIAICGKMDEKEFYKLLVTVDGESVNTKNPTDVVYYYAYKRGYSLSRANELNDKFNKAYSTLKPDMAFSEAELDDEIQDKQFLNGLIAGFGREDYNELLRAYLAKDDCKKENNKDNVVNSSDRNTMEIIWDYLADNYADRIEGMKKDEAVECIANSIATEHKNICKPPLKHEKVRKWFAGGKIKKKDAFRLGLSLSNINYDDYLKILQSIDGIEYDFSKEEYCIYYYSKKRGYDLQKADWLQKEFFYSVTPIGLTHHFDDFYNSDLNEDEADQNLIQELVILSDKMKVASIHNIAKFARLSQYVVEKYNGFKDVKVKMNYNSLFPQGAQLYKAIYGVQGDSYCEGQKTIGKGEGVFYDFVAKYFKDYGNRLKDKYDILMGNRRIDLRYHGVKRMEILTLIYPFLLSDKHISKDDLKPFKCDNAKMANKEWEKDIQSIWDEFDKKISEVQEYLESTIKPLSHKTQEMIKSGKKSSGELKQLLGVYEKAFNIILKEFGFINMYPPYIGDRFFLINLLANNPLEWDNNIALSALEHAGWDPEWDIE